MARKPDTEAAPAASDPLLAQCREALLDHERRFRSAMARGAWQDDRTMISELLGTIHALRTEIAHLEGSAR